MCRAGPRPRHPLRTRPLSRPGPASRQDFDATVSSGILHELDQALKTDLLSSPSTFLIMGRTFGVQGRVYYISSIADPTPNPKVVGQFETCEPLRHGSSDSS